MNEQMIKTIKEWEEQGILEIIIDDVVVSEIEENLLIQKGAFKNLIDKV